MESILGLLGPHIDLANTKDDDIKRLADKVSALNLNIGSLVAQFGVDRRWAAKRIAPICRDGS